MADDDSWFAGDDDETPTAEAEGAPAEAAAAGEDVTAAEGGEGGEGEEPGESGPAPEAEDEYLDPDKLILFKHWKRPKFLGYQYLYLYRLNYYDDVMDYLDKRASGVSREIPRAQTWAERILRTFSNKVTQYSMYTKRFRRDTELVEKTRISGKTFEYHVKNVFNRQFSKLLY